MTKILAIVFVCCVGLYSVTFGDTQEIAKILAGTLTEPQEDFKEVGENLETKNKCPKCSYEW